jgi:secreted trypsin-like serine protease
MARLIGSDLTTDPATRTDSRIVGGTVAPPQLHPFQIALLQKNVASDYQAAFCGGTLVADQYIITAAHCSEFLTKDVAVLVGKRNLTGKGNANRVNVSEIYIHPKYQSTSKDYDVAVWKLAKPVSGIPFAQLPARGTDPLPSTSTTVSGWGTTKYKQNSYPRELRAVSIPVVDRETCNSPNSYSGSITSRMFCAGEQGKDSCQGDSGGPITRSPSNKILIGVVSFGVGCGWSRFPGVYTRLANPEIYDFVTSKISQ